MSKGEIDDGRVESPHWRAAGTVHDVNNLLMLVIGCAELALDDDTLSPDTRRLVQEIVGVGERATSLTRNFLSQGKPAVASTTVVDVADVLRSAETLLRRLVGDHISLRLSPGSAPQWVLAEASQLEQVIVNLALNARDAMPTGGALSIAVGEVTGHSGTELPFDARRVTRVTVTDTGRGIDPAIQGRMYEAFATTKTTGKGSGLGLAVVRAIVDQLGGSIHMTTAPGHGTTFAIDLPQTAEPGTPIVTS